MPPLPERQQKLGARAEEAYRLELVRQRKEGFVDFFCRPEWIVFPRDGDPHCVEVKGKELFTAPPFDGHGLDVYQAERYDQLRVALGLRTRLIIYDPGGYRYEAWLDDLERRGSDYVFTTNGDSPCRIYEIGGFEAHELNRQPRAVDPVKGESTNSGATARVPNNRGVPAQPRLDSGLT